MNRRNANVRGFTGKLKHYRGVTIREFVVGYAYPRNGNVHNPTPEKAWYVGGEHFTLLRDAKAAIDDNIETDSASEEAEREADTWQ